MALFNVHLIFCDVAMHFKLLFKQSKFFIVYALVYFDCFPNAILE